VIDPQREVHLLEQPGQPVLSLTAKPRWRSSAAILAVVRRVHTQPGDRIPGGVVLHQRLDPLNDFWRFFHRFTPASPGPDSVKLDVLGEQLASSPRDSAHIKAEQLGDARITAATRVQGFEPCVQAPLLLIEQAEENNTMAARSSSGRIDASGRGPSTRGCASRARRASNCWRRRTGSVSTYRNRPANSSRTTRIACTSMRNASLVATCSVSSLHAPTTP